MTWSNLFPNASASMIAYTAYEGHFRSNENVIILAYSILLTSKVIYQLKHHPLDITFFDDT